MGCAHTLAVPQRSYGSESHPLYQTTGWKAPQIFCLAHHGNVDRTPQHASIGYQKLLAIIMAFRPHNKPLTFTQPWKENNLCCPGIGSIHAVIFSDPAISLRLPSPLPPIRHKRAGTALNNGAGISPSHNFPITEPQRPIIDCGPAA